jgi:hypothetical protein
MGTSGAVRRTAGVVSLGIALIAPAVAHAAEPEVFPGGAAPVAPAPPGPITLPDPAVMHASNVVVVHIETPRDVELEVLRGGKWQLVCGSPCDRPLSLDDLYRINGPGVRPSYGFRLDPSRETTLHVDPTSSAAHTFAVVITAVGAVGFVPILVTSVIFVGGMFFALILVCPIVEDLGTRTAAQYNQCLGDAAGILGQFYAKPGVWIPALAGLALVGAGALGINATPKSSVSQVRLRMDPPVGAARVPVWSEATRAVLPVTPTFPIVDVRF